MSDLLALMEQEATQELRIEPRTPPLLFAQGRGKALELPSLGSEEIQRLFQSIATAEQLHELESCGDARFLYTSQDSAALIQARFFERKQLKLQIRNLRV